MAPVKIYLKRPPIEVLLDWVFEKLQDCRTLIVWDGDTFETYVVAERTQGQTMNFSLDYLWALLMADQVQIEQAHKGRESELEYVE